MAICTCPNCGKKISDRSMVCPFCNMPIGAQESAKIQNGRRSPKTRIIGIAVPAILTIMALLIWRILMYGLLAMFGEAFQEGFMLASGQHVFKSIPLVAISAALFWATPSIVNGKQKSLYIILTVTCCLIHFIVILLGTIYPYTKSLRLEINVVATTIGRVLVLTYGLAVPLLQGALSLMSGYGNFKQALIWQGVYAGIFLILSALLAWCGMWGAELGMVALGVSALVAALLIFGATLCMTTYRKK